MITSKLVSNNSVRLYTMLVKDINSLEPQTAHYVYCFLNRLSQFRLEQRFKTPAIVADSKSSSSSCDSLTLGHMLFNIQTFSVFSDVLNDSRLCSKSYLEPLIRVIKLTIRRFSEAVKKNNLLFAEILFYHAQPHNFCETLDNVYEAASYFGGAGDNGAGGNTSEINSGSEEENSSAIRARTSRMEGLFEEEFDDAYDFGSGALDTQENSSKVVRKKGTKRRSKKTPKKPSVSISDDSTSDSSANGNARLMGSDEDEIQNRTSKTKPSSKIVKKKIRSFVPWTSEEDEILKSQYKLFMGTRSVLDIIVHDQQLREIGNNRKLVDIERRVVELELHLQGGRVNDDVESSGDRMGDDALYGYTGNDTLNGQEQVSVQIPGIDAIPKIRNTVEKVSVKKNSIEKRVEDSNASDDDIFNESSPMESKLATSTISINKRRLMVDSDED